MAAFQGGRARRDRDGSAGLRTRVFTGRTVGREFDVMLGTANPWLLIAAPGIAAVSLTRFASWAGAVSVAVLSDDLQRALPEPYSGQAAERSRALWLRGHWSRAELFVAVERSFWRHNAHRARLVVAGHGRDGSVYAGLPATLLVAAGLPLVFSGRY